MRIAVSWLERYLSLEENYQNLPDLLTFAGIEVEAIEQLKALGSTVVAAKVISAVPVPKTDHLKLCRVDIGDVDYSEKDANNSIDIICGAPNCSSNMMAVLALPGTKLKDINIAKAKIRGIQSHGMLCSERELGLSDNHSGIIRLPDEIKIGALADELFGFPDTIFELEITPNRSDLLGYRGIARDLSAKLGIPLKPLNVDFAHNDCTKLKLGLYNEAPEQCPRYTARVFEHVKVKESPLWLKIALVKSGLRPINNLVDITNFVMLENGHPLHAFDYDTLASKNEGQAYPDILIRKAYNKESFEALDGKVFELDSDDLVIADGKRASALAGVMGSKYSGISENTINIVLESAAFHPGTIRRTSYKHKLSSDSSYRFERHLSAQYVHETSERATALILELAEAKAYSNIIDSYPKEEEKLVLGVRPARFEHLIGYPINPDEIYDILVKLGFEYVGDAAFKAGRIEDFALLNKSKDNADYAQYYQIPGYRKDITREADILEELARLKGYDLVPQRTAPKQIMDWHAYRIEKRAAEWVVNWGAYETLNYSFTDPAQMQSLGVSEQEIPYIHVINPQNSNQSVMRVSLVPQLITNLVYNLNHYERDIRLFELGKVYFRTKNGHKEPKHLGAICTGNVGEEHFKAKNQQIDYSWAKGCFEGLIQDIGITGHLKPYEAPYLISGETFAFYQEDKIMGYFGRLKAPILEAWGIDATNLKQEVWLLYWDVDVLIISSRKLNTTFSNISRYPSVVRDLSFLLADTFSYAEVKAHIMAVDTNLIQDVRVFDEYRSEQIPEGFRSLSLHIVLQDQEKTLTDERVDQLMNLVQKTLIDKYDIKMR
ncbi:MAG: phenylalanine--tRNA ligase subunit beta [Candidatus Cloacimonetes bacterium]|nr:phenylalanine--tRNA ligase subunit beta [Candidatus Cloacimonadota bacterium]